MSNVTTAIRRYNLNGTLDTRFDSDGIMLVDRGHQEKALAAAVARKGRIVVAGETGGSQVHDVLVLRLAWPDPYSPRVDSTYVQYDYRQVLRTSLTMIWTAPGRPIWRTTSCWRSTVMAPRACSQSPASAMTR